MMIRRIISSVTIATAAIAVLGLLVYIVVTQSTLINPLQLSRSAMPQNETENTQPLPDIKRPRIVVKKANRTLELFDGDELVRRYRIALGGTPEGDKEIEGDGKTPEGDFYIFGKNPASKYFLSIGISYPNAEDAERGERAGLLTVDEANEIRSAIAEMRTPPQKTKLGGEIYIHGGGNAADWTQGCIAMTNKDIKELFNILPNGTPVTVLP